MSSNSQEMVATPTSRQRPSPTIVMLPFVLVALIVATSPNFRFQSDPNAEPFGGDFIQEWVGGWIVCQGDRTRLYDLSYAQSLQHTPELVGFEWDRGSYLPMVYPPFYYLLVSPLSMWPLKVAAVVWSVLMACCLAGTIFLVRKSYSTENSILVWGVPLALLFPPLIESLSSGQKSTLLLLLFTASYLLLNRQKSFWAGVIFGLLAFKPQLALVVLVTMLIKRQWYFLVGAMVTGCFLVGLSLAVGVDVCQHYFEWCTGMASYVHTGGYDLHKAHCWWGACQLILGWAPDLVVKGFAIAGSLVTVVLLARLMRDTSETGPFDTNSPRFALQYSGMILATLLLSPHLFTYDLTLLLLPMLLIVTTMRHFQSVLGCHRRPVLAMAILLFVMSGLFAPLAAATCIQLSVPIMVAWLWSLWQSVADQYSTSSTATAALQPSFQYELVQPYE